MSNSSNDSVRKSRENATEDVRNYREVLRRARADLEAAPDSRVNQIRVECGERLFAEKLETFFDLVAPKETEQRRRGRVEGFDRLETELAKDRTEPLR